jgi:hypothetical protein
MPYPESCPECAGPFRNTGTHFTARRNEVGRRVLLELGCQTTNRRFWWDFTMGQVTSDGKTPAPAQRAPRPAGKQLVALTQTNGSAPSGHLGLDGREPPGLSDGVLTTAIPGPGTEPRTAEPRPEPGPAGSGGPHVLYAPGEGATYRLTAPEVEQPPTLQAAFVRQLELDRLTLRQMRTWVASDEARRAAEVAAGATEATYERLALACFGTSLATLLAQAGAVAPSSTALTAEEKLEIQREKARIRARQRRAALKANKLAAGG